MLAITIYGHFHICYTNLYFLATRVPDYYTWTSDRYVFELLLRSYEVKAQTHTLWTSMGSDIGPCFSSI